MRIGLTGGIGAGKTTAANYLRKLGVYVLDADDASRMAVEPDSAGLAALVLRYGRRILLQGGELDRARLADIIFSSAEERAAVEALLHPPTIQLMRALEDDYKKRCPTAPVVWDVALLIETGMHTFMDEVWLVVADDEMRAARVMRRDRCTKEQAYVRIYSQMPQYDKIKYADKVVHNSTTLEEFHWQVYSCVERLLD
ncbi:MAG: dephospho-CoA kinase [Clostridiales bacterium]|nr:dephospho-CoA kinase [Clostridiales bacterium]